MDDAGRLTDELGRRIEIGMQVRVIDSYEPGTYRFGKSRTGRVTSLGSMADGEIVFEPRADGRMLGLQRVRATAVRIVLGDEALERLRTAASASWLATVVVATADLRLLVAKLPSDPAVERLRHWASPALLSNVVVATADLRAVLDTYGEALGE